MTSLRKRKTEISRALLTPSILRVHEDALGDQMRPIGREFGSPDFERLVDDDRRNRVGAFDPALDGMLSSVEVPEDMPVQRRKRL